MKHRPWWQSFQVVGYVVAGLAAVGTSIIVTSKYLTLPERVEAGETKNAQQDKQLDRLITLQEYYQQQQQLPNASRPSAPSLPVPQAREWVERDADGSCWSCKATTYETCWRDNPTTEQVDNFWERCN